MYAVRLIYEKREEKEIKYIYIMILIQVQEDGERTLGMSWLAATRG